jgi:hypothetical protein
MKGEKNETRGRDSQGQEENEEPVGPEKYKKPEGKDREEGKNPVRTTKIS